MSTCTVLEGAKELLDNGRGWTQFKMYDFMTDRRCLLGAVVRAAQDQNEDAGPTIKLVEKVLPEGFSIISGYNDFITTRWSDIEKVLDKAIETCEG